MSELNRPPYYGGEENPYEVIKVLEAWNPLYAYAFCWGNVIKYNARAGSKGHLAADLQKAQTYQQLGRDIIARHPDVDFTTDGRSLKLAVKP